MDNKTVKQGLKNYASGLKYFFTPLGTMFLGMMIGLSILLPGVLSASSTLIDGIKALAESVNLDYNVLISNIGTSMQTLDWTKPLEAFRTMLSVDWLKSTMAQVLHTILGTDFETFQAEIFVLIDNFAAAVKLNFIAFIIFWVLGFIAGYFLLKFQIRRKIAKRSIWRFLLATSINSILTSAFMITALILLFMWRWSIIISAILIVLLVSLFALLEAFIVHGQKGIPLKSIVNVRNAGLYALTNSLIFLISILITVVVYLINFMTGLFVGLTLIEIATIVTGLNAESFVISSFEKIEPDVLAVQ